MDGMTNRERQNFVNMLMRDFGLTFEQALLKLAEVEEVHPYKADEND